MGLWEQLDCRAAPPRGWQRTLARVVATAPGSVVGSRVLPVADTFARRVGTRTLTEVLAGLPTITLVSTGARSGLRRESHLVAIPAGAGDLAVIGSNFGGTRTPSWVHNLRADPRVELHHGAAVAAATAVPLTGEPAQQVWERGRAMYAGFAVYPARAAHREITVWLLEAPTPERPQTGALG